MRKGDLVVHHSPPGEFSKLWLYREIPKPEVPTISIATAWPWAGGMHGIVLRSGWGTLVHSRGSSCNHYLQVLTSMGHVGWIHRTWAMKVGAE